MSHSRFRQVARLETFALPYIQRRLADDTERMESFRSRAFSLVASLCVLLLYGDPHIDEPLSEAWSRSLQSDALKAWGENCLDSEEGNCDRRSDPFSKEGAMHVAEYFRQRLMPDLPGANDTEKLNAILKTAPTWLLWFTCADFYGRSLGLEIPDVSRMSRFERHNTIWGGLPSGRFERDPLPPGKGDLYHTAYLQRREAAALGHELPSNLTRRERERVTKIYRALGLSVR